MLVTCRAVWEGGHFKGSEEERQRILREALDAGAEYVDIEWKAQGVDLRLLLAVPENLEPGAPRSCVRRPDPVLSDSITAADKS